MEIRALREGDDRSAFRSGEADLDRFFRKYAGQNQFRHFIGVTYVAVESGRILGFATVSPGHLEVDRLPEAERRRFPRYPLPVLRLARLAVDESARGRGLGAVLLRYVLRLALRTAGTLGCAGVAVDALPDAVGFYRRCGFVEIDAVEGRSDARPPPVLLFLPLAAIRAASGVEDLL
jgi:GNAT superfamily N-acetyltransferase